MPPSTRSKTPGDNGGPSKSPKDRRRKQGEPSADEKSSDSESQSSSEDEDLNSTMKENPSQILGSENLPKDVEKEGTLPSGASPDQQDDAGKEGTPPSGAPKPNPDHDYSKSTKPNEKETVNSENDPKNVPEASRPDTSVPVDISAKPAPLSKKGKKTDKTKSRVQDDGSDLSRLSDPSASHTSKVRGRSGSSKARAGHGQDVEFLDEAGVPLTRIERVTQLHAMLSSGELNQAEFLEKLTIAMATYPDEPQKSRKPSKSPRRRKTNTDNDNEAELGDNQDKSTKSTDTTSSKELRQHDPQNAFHRNECDKCYKVYTDRHGTSWADDSNTEFEGYVSGQTPRKKDKPVPKGVTVPMRSLGGTSTPVPTDKVNKKTDKKQSKRSKSKKDKTKSRKRRRSSSSSGSRRKKQEDPSDSDPTDSDKSDSSLDSTSSYYSVESSDEGKKKRNKKRKTDDSLGSRSNKNDKS